MPAFPVTVSGELYDEVADARGEPFADSYLHGAVLTNNHLFPRTQTAWIKLRDDRECRKAFERLGITLEKPAPWGTERTRLAA